MSEESVSSFEATGRLSSRNFSRLSAFIHDYSGIKIPPGKKVMVEGRLRRRVRALGLADLDDYCRYLFEDGGLGDEAVPLIDAVTTNKTDFFREAEHFRYLTETALPLLGRRDGSGTRRPLKVWSSACSTGAEPYTLAMVISDYARQTSGYRASILATDICTDVLKTAVAGVYSEEMIRPVPLEMRQRYVLRSRDRARGVVRMAPDIRAMVRFGRLNLMDQQYPIDVDMDVIFCRNILIYFDKPTQYAVLSRLCRHLRTGGYFFLGHSETIAGLDLPLRTTATTVFVKT